eukprot:TRINITY_DN11595_c0_g1_i3.p1 TRINITY_DN11595_c0_g1~~TRINITY_DN11595_c0_g1_i3.p1  ORF type:complete len:730 (+),score=173.34 TRINITY_DN11595_c0_g1_i3:98-2287(+)
MDTLSYTSDDDSFFSCQDFSDDEDLEDAFQQGGSESSGSFTRSSSITSMHRAQVVDPVTLNIIRRASSAGVAPGTEPGILLQTILETNEPSPSSSTYSNSTFTSTSSYTLDGSLSRSENIGGDMENASVASISSSGETESQKLSPVQERGKFKSLMTKIKTKGEAVSQKIIAQIDKAHTTSPILSSSPTAFVPSQDDRFEKLDKDRKDKTDDRPRTMERILNKLSLGPSTSSAGYIYAQVKKKSRKEFGSMMNIQKIKAHSHSIWTMRFSRNGRVLATGGSDGVVRIWRVGPGWVQRPDTKRRAQSAPAPINPAILRESLIPSGPSALLPSTSSSSSSSTTTASTEIPVPTSSYSTITPPNMTPTSSTPPAHFPKGPQGQDQYNFLETVPVAELQGHEEDVLDLAWCAPTAAHAHGASSTMFLLSASMDHTVRLWAIDLTTPSDPVATGLGSRCLQVFQHPDIVTSVSCHPKDDAIFVSSSLDGKVRLWSVVEKRIRQEAALGDYITSTTFTIDGKTVVAGSHGGMCFFLEADSMISKQQLHVHSSRGKHKKGAKITGIEPLPGGESMIVTSNDSRIRLYNLATNTMLCKYKGLVNDSFQIRASLSSTGRYIICGSDDQSIYIWNTNQEYSIVDKLRRDRQNDHCHSYEAFPAHNKVVTVTAFAPAASAGTLDPTQTELFTEEEKENILERRFIVSGDSSGFLKVFENHTTTPVSVPIHTFQTTAAPII